LIPKEGTAQLCKTSLEVTKVVTIIFLGIKTLEETSNNLYSPFTKSIVSINLTSIKVVLIGYPIVAPT
jgi:hypothetical protein